MNFLKGRVEPQKRKKFYVLSHPIAFEELGREQFTLDYLPAERLAAPGMPGSQAIEPSPAHQAALSPLRGHDSFPDRLGSPPPANRGFGPDIAISRTCLSPVSGLRQSAFTPEVPPCAFHLEENCPGSRGSRNQWGLPRFMLRKGSRYPWEHTPTSPGSR